VGYFWRERDIFQGETNKVISRVVLPVLSNRNLKPLEEMLVIE
jgi:hypothetical protein